MTMTDSTVNTTTTAATVSATIANNSTATDCTSSIGSSSSLSNVSIEEEYQKENMNNETTIKNISSNENTVSNTTSTGSCANNTKNNHTILIRYRITGIAAYTRIQPLLEQLLIKYQYKYFNSSIANRILQWIDCSPYNSNSNCKVDKQEDNEHDSQQQEQDVHNEEQQNNVPINFLWENAPRMEMKYLLGDNDNNTTTNTTNSRSQEQNQYQNQYQTSLQCYSHLPNGTNILDSKWVLSRFFSLLSNNNIDAMDSSIGPETSNNTNKYLAIVPSYCFIGRDGYDSIITYLRTVSNTHNHTKTNTCDDIYTSNDIDTTTSTDSIRTMPATSPTTATTATSASFRDLDPSYDAIAIANNNSNSSSSYNDGNTNNWWVIKDSMSNGAGGIWMIDVNNSSNDIDIIDNTSTTETNNNTNSIQSTRNQLIDNHNYIIQQYVYPLVLYQQRKCHIRCYCLLTSSGKIYLHNQCFIHVANELFTNTTSTNTTTNTTTTSATATTNTKEFQDSIHITNCCANSHDTTKFSGEIIASFDFDGISSSSSSSSTSTSTSISSNNDTENNVIVGIKRFKQSIEQSIILLMKHSYPFVQGGSVNNGFEYLGLDFILSYQSITTDNTDTSNSGTSSRNNIADTDTDTDTVDTMIPVAYLLEVNAPPSQDTASGLQHAEELHNTVLFDLLTLWVLPNILLPTIVVEPVYGGWNEVYDYYYCNDNDTTDTTKNSKQEMSSTTTNTRQLSDIPYSKAVLINKIRWMIYENKLKKLSLVSPSPSSTVLDNTSSDAGRDNTATANDIATINVSVTKSLNNSQQNNKCNIFITHQIRTLFQYFHSNSHVINDEDLPRTTNRYTNSDTCPLTDENDTHYSVDEQKQQELNLQDTGCSSVELSTPAAPEVMAANENPIFFENAGGTQVPTSVIHRMVLSLQYRHRNMIGSNSKLNAIRTMYTLLGATPSKYVLSFNSNASTLLYTLANRYIHSNMLQQYDEIIICIDNHLANVQPWIYAATTVGAIIKWWYPSHRQQKLLTTSSKATIIQDSTKSDKVDDISFNNDSTFDYNDTEYSNLKKLITSKTRIVAIPHVSNILGKVMDIRTIRRIVHEKQYQLLKQQQQQQQQQYAHMVVDGVSAVPHIFANIDELDVDWYVVSLHKMFGPHCGILCGKESIASKLLQYSESQHHKQQHDIVQPICQPSALDIGTVNYEACEGIYGVGCYFQKLASLYNSQSTICTSAGSVLIPYQVKDAYNLIKELEIPLENALLAGLSRSSKVRIIGHTRESTLQQQQQQQQQHQYYQNDSSQKKYQTTQEVDSINDMNHNTNGTCSLNYIPLVSFIHETISSNEIVTYCNTNDIICRCGTFLSTEQLWNEYVSSPSSTSVLKSAVDDRLENDIVRLSLVHYNTISEINYTIKVLEQLPNWM